jgi:uncharacterized protein (TIGR02271 family)
MKTVIGLVKDLDVAKETMEELVHMGVSPESISIVSQETVAQPPFAMSTVTIPGLGAVRAAGPMLKRMKSSRNGSEGVADALTTFGFTQKDANAYLDGVRHGATLETALVDDDHAEGALNILRAHALTLNVPARTTGTKPNESPQPDPQLRIPIVEEELFIGKREVDAGGIRVATHTVSTPVEQRVTVREEHVTIRRRPVNRPLEAGDADPFGDRAIELHAMTEEPVVSKHAHVVEEIVIHKDIKERTETVHDSLRKTKVDAADLEGAEAAKKKNRSRSRTP